MNPLQAVFLGILQGFTEFLPVSSSGHLVLFQKIFGFTEPAMTFDIVVHLGSLTAVFIVFRQDILALLRKPFQKTAYLLAAATVPAALAGVFLEDAIEGLFQGGLLLGAGFLITGALLLYADRVKDGKKRESDITYLDALVIGCMQAVATAPGVSRSGSTICGSLFRGLSRETAARFSFLMSIPIILGAALVQLIKGIRDGLPPVSGGLLPMALGFVGAALAGYLSVRFMLRLIKECRLRCFAYYVFVLGALIAADYLVFHTVFV